LKHLKQHAFLQTTDHQFDTYDTAKLWNRASERLISKIQSLHIFSTIIYSCFKFQHKRLFFSKCFQIIQHATFLRRQKLFSFLSFQQMQKLQESESFVFSPLQNTSNKNKQLLLKKFSSLHWNQKQSKTRNKRKAKPNSEVGIQ
jgi:hypothetical protein